MSAKIPPKPNKEVIYVDVDDEITSIIDKVENADEKVVALVLPKRFASLQSIVNMKLLKRSADGAGKSVVLITSEVALLPLAGAAGLHVAKNLQSAPEVPKAPSGSTGSAAVAAAAGAAAARKLSDDEDEEPASDDDAVDKAGEEDLPGKIDYNAPVGALAVAHAAGEDDDDNSETIDLDDEDEASAKDETAPKAAKKPKDKKPKGAKVPDFDRFRMLMFLGIAGAVALVVFIILAIFVLPKATITITTTGVPVSTEFTVTASTSIKTLDVAKGQIPATQQTTDQTGSQQVQATGQQNNGQSAAGNISFSIPCSSVSGSPPTIPAGTGVTSNGLSYITQSSASLTTPAFSPCRFTGSSTIKAIAAGSKYNIGDSTFTVSGYSSVTGSGSASGGTDDIVTVVSQADVQSAQQKVVAANNSEEFIKTYKKKLEDQGLYVINSTLKIGDPQVSSSPAVGQPASNATVTVKVTYTVLTVKKDDLTAVVEAKLAGQIDKSKQKLSGNYLNDTTISVVGQSSATSATLNVSVETTAVPIISEATVKKVSVGKKSGEINATITAWPGVKTVDIKLSPFWVSKVPTKDKKVTVVIKEVKVPASSTKNSSEP